MFHFGGFIRDIFGKRGPGREHHRNAISAQVSDGLPHGPRTREVRVIEQEDVSLSLESHVDDIRCCVMRETQDSSSQRGLVSQEFAKPRLPHGLERVHRVDQQQSWGLVARFQLVQHCLLPTLQRRSGRGGFSCRRGHSREVCPMLFSRGLNSIRQPRAIMGCRQQA